MEIKCQFVTKSISLRELAAASHSFHSYLALASSSADIFHLILYPSLLLSGNAAFCNICISAHRSTCDTDVTSTMQ